MQGRRYDPIYTASIKPNNVHLHTLYTSPGLTLVSVTPFWAVALKLVRYQKHDPADITAILRNGTRLNGVQWSVEILERWLQTECWAMGYGNYPDWLKRDMRERIGHAVAQLREGPQPPTNPPVPSRSTSLDVHEAQLQPRHRGLPRHKSMTFTSSRKERHPGPDSTAQPLQRQHSIPFPEPQIPSHRSLVRRSSMDFPVIPREHSHIPNQHAPPPSQSQSIPVPMPMPVPQIPQHAPPHSTGFSHQMGSGEAPVMPPHSAPHTSSRMVSPSFPALPSSASTISFAHHPMLMPPPSRQHSHGLGWTSHRLITA